MIKINFEECCKNCNERYSYLSEFVTFTDDRCMNMETKVGCKHEQVCKDYMEACNKKKVADRSYDVTGTEKFIDTLFDKILSVLQVGYLSVSEFYKISGQEYKILPGDDYIGWRSNGGFLQIPPFDPCDVDSYELRVMDTPVSIIKRGDK